MSAGRPRRFYGNGTDVGSRKGGFVVRRPADSLTKTGPSAASHTKHLSKAKLGQPAQSAPCGGRTWWAHFEFTRINIEPIILKIRSKSFESRARLRAVHVGIVRRRSLVRVTLGCRPAHRAVPTRAPHRAGGTP